MVLVHAYTYDNFLERFCLDNDNYMSAWIIPSEGCVYSSEQSIVKGYYKYLGNCTYETVGKNPNGSPKYNTLRVFCEVDEPIDDTKLKYFQYVQLIRVRVKKWIALCWVKLSGKLWVS